MTETWMDFFLSLLNPEAGLLALIFAFCFWSAQALTAFFIPPQTEADFSKALSFAGLVSVFIAFSALLTAFGSHDFSVKLTAENSASNAPLLYRLAASWGNHNGSLLLWLFLLGICNHLGVRNFAKFKDLALKRFAVLTLGLLSAAIAAFSLFTSNPFARLFPAPLEGAGLNPLLLDPGLACHPPLLYAGYVAFSVPFALTFAALLKGSIDQEMLLCLRQWVLLGWAFLSIGIILGAWWAYGTLGWGGYWFWDPVENASLMPWLTATALLHTSALSAQKQRLVCWSLALSLLSFILALMATFLVRSGIINSVHSFAANPTKGEAVLLMMFISIFAGFGLFAWRSPQFKELPSEAGFLSLEKAVALLCILLCTLLTTVLTGTLYPPLSQFLAGYILSVGKPFFDQTIPPTALLILLLMGCAFFLPREGRISLQDLGKKTAFPLLAAFLGAMLAFWMKMTWIGGLFFFASCWMIVATLKSLYDFLRTSGKIHKTQWRRKAGFFPLFFAHIGIGISIMGLCGLSASEGDVAILAAGENILIGHQRWQLDSVQHITGSDYQGIQAHLSLWNNQKKRLAVLQPERRFYLRQRQAISKPAVNYQFFQDYYAVLSAVSAEKGKEKFLLKLRTHPLGSWFWIGGILTVFCVFWRFFDQNARRFSKS